MEIGLEIPQGGGSLGAMKRHKTKYPGVFFREADRVGETGVERVFYIVFKKNGKVYEEKVGRQYSDDMTPARAARIRGERIEGRRPSRKEERRQEEERKRTEEGRWTFSRLWDEYRRSHPHIKGLAKDEDRFNRYLREPFGDKEPSQLVPLDVDRIRLGLSKTLKPATVRNVLELFRRLVNFGVKKHLCPGISFTICMPRVNNQKTEMLTPEEIHTFLQVLDLEPNIQVANMLRLMLFTGMRPGEVYKLRWEDIDFDRGTIILRDPKSGRDEMIPLNSMTRQILIDHPKLDESAYVFPGAKGGPRKSAYNAAVRIKKEAGLPDDFRPQYGLRHVFATELASSGEVELYHLQKLLTHKSPQMTQRYAHLRDEALKKASELVGRMTDPNKHKRRLGETLNRESDENGM